VSEGTGNRGCPETSPRRGERFVRFSRYPLHEKCFNSFGTFFISILDLKLDLKYSIINHKAERLNLYYVKYF